MTPDEKAAAIGAAHGAEIDALFVEALMLTPTDAPLAGKAIRIYEITDRIGEMIAPHAPCRRGCSHCCYQAVGIAEHEAERIAKAVGRAPQGVDSIRSLASLRDCADGLREVARMQQRYAGVPCSFLDEASGECSIYEDRPLACRSMFNLLDDPSVCDIRTNPGSSVPMIDVRQLWEAQAMLAFKHEQAFGDIREFFPREAAR